VFALADDIAPDEVTLLAVPDHLSATHAAKRAQRRHQVNRFEDVGLPLGVVAEQEVKARCKVRIQPRIVAEVAESQMGQMHSRENGARAAGSRVFLAPGKARRAFLPGNGIILNAMQDDKAPAAPPKLVWPPYAIAAGILAVLLFVAWMSVLIKRTHDQNPWNPMPGEQTTNAPH
jgi:hypothetical protein